jgi:hypothetical protein
MAGGAESLMVPNAHKSGLRTPCHLLGPSASKHLAQHENVNFHPGSSNRARAISHADQPWWGIPGGDLCAFGTMSRPEHPAKAGVTATKQQQVLRIK